MNFRKICKLNFYNFFVNFISGKSKKLEKNWKKINENPVNSIFENEKIFMIFPNFLEFFFNF